MDLPIWRFYQAASIHRTYVIRDLLPKHGLIVDLAHGTNMVDHRRRTRNGPKVRHGAAFRRGLRYRRTMTYIDPSPARYATSGVARVLHRL